MEETHYLTTLPEPQDVQVVVLMGGLGSRLGERTKQRPKPLLDIHGQAFFDYQLRLLQTYGFRKFLFLVGYQADIIENYYKDGSSRGISIRYSYDGEKLLGTGGAVRKAFDILEDDFLLIYGDSFMDIDYRETIYRYFHGKRYGYQALMVILENRNQFDKSNVVFEHGKICLYDKQRPTEQMHHIDYGIGMFEKRLFQDFGADEMFDIAALQNRLSRQNKLSAHEVTKRFYEIGSPGALEEFRQYADIRYGSCQKAVFLDRDGVINDIVFRDETEQLDSPLNPEEVQLKEGIVPILKELQASGYYLFIVTNQPAAAKGKTSLKNLYDTNTFLCKLLLQKGIYIDSVGMCPHYPKETTETKEKFLIRSCKCRKPQSGMIEEICRRFLIDRQQSWMIGDSYTDIIAGKKAGLRTIFYGSYKCDICRYLEFNKPDYICRELSEILNCIRRK